MSLTQIAQNTWDESLDLFSEILTDISPEAEECSVLLDMSLRLRSPASLM